MTEAVDVSDKLARDKRGFFQLLRLLRLQLGNDEAFRAGVRVRPSLSLGFPKNDIETVERDEDDIWQVEANFFGLYGTTSPLPTFYTEDLIDEAMQGQASTRDFLDLIHAALYPLLYRAWEKYRLWLRIAEHHEQAQLDRLYALVGLQQQNNTPYASTLLAHAGLFSWRPRSALGLQSLLSSALGNVPVQVDTCVEREISIPVPGRTMLGIQASVLGEDSLLGHRVPDRAGNLSIIIGPLPAETFISMLPGASHYALTEQILRHYLETPLRCVLHLLIEPGHRQGIALGESWSRLGEQTWLGSPATAWADLPTRAVRFPIAQQQ
jgi:type VI secretion system protein ImpH